MSGKRMLLTLPRFPSSEEQQEQGNACRELETKKIETGANLFERNREKYDLVVEMLRDQRPVRDIAKECQVSFSTLSSVRRHAGLSAEAEKDALTETIRVAARVVAERVLELGDQMSPKEASISLGILVDKLQLTQGEATSICLTRSERVLTHQEWLSLIDALPLANATVVNSESNAEGAK